MKYPRHICNRRGKKLKYAVRQWLAAHIGGAIRYSVISTEDGIALRGSIADPRYIVPAVTVTISPDCITTVKMVEK